MKKFLLIIMLLTFISVAHADYEQVWPISRGGTGNTSGNAATVTNGIYSTDTGTVTNTMLAGSIANGKLSNASTTVNSQTCTLGSTCTVAAPAGTLTGTTLASGVTSSSLTSFGSSIALGTPMSCTLTNCTFPTLNQNTSGTAASLSGALSANQVLGSLTAVAPSGQSVPSCSTSSSALKWTSGTGFSCNTSIAASTVTNGVYTTDTGTVTNTMLAGSIANAKLSNSSTTVNGQTCTLGSSCTISAAASLVVGSTSISSGNSGYVEYNNAGTLGEIQYIPSSAGGTGGSSGSSTGVAQVSSGTWSYSTALVNGTTATTQAVGDTSTDLSTDAFVAAAIANQVDMHDPVIATTTGVLSGSPSYSNGSSGVGATLTSTTPTILVFDGVTPVSTGGRYLIQNQVASLQNGCYSITTLGTALINYVLTRCTDFNQVSNVGYGDTFPVLQGTANANQQFTMNNTAFTTMGAAGSTGNITFAQTSGGSQLSAGTGITITGNSVAVTNPLTALSANQVLGSLTAVVPTGQSMPSCSTSASALQWTSGTGFSCNTAVSASTVATNANLTGDVTSSGNSTTVAKIAGVAVGTPTGTGNVVMSASPTLTGTLTTAGTNQPGFQISYNTSGTTWTSPSYASTNMTFKVTVIAGGGGGGVGGTGTKNGTGGGSGGVCVRYYNTIAASTGYTYAVGAAGSNSTFSDGTTTLTASAGGAGASTGGTGGAAGTCTNATYSYGAQNGGSAPLLQPAGDGGGTNGGGSPWGVGGLGQSATTGGAGTGCGGGGGGVANGFTAGAGTTGCVIIEWVH